MAEITRRELVLILASIPHVSCEGPHRLIRLAGVDLSGLDLRGLNLAHADFAGANLREADLSDAQLYACDFSSADLTGAILRGVYAERAVFAHAVMTNADLRPSPRNLFFGTSLVGADFTAADLTDARLSGADLCGARFEDAILLRADFQGSRVNDATVIDRDALHSTPALKQRRTALRIGVLTDQACASAGASVPIQFRDGCSRTNAVVAA